MVAWILFGLACWFGLDLIFAWWWIRTVDNNNVEPEATSYGRDPGLHPSRKEPR